MQAVCIKIFEMSIAASWLILVVILLRIFLVKAPKNFRYILWALVAIRLICPFSVKSDFSLVPDMNGLLSTEMPGVEVPEQNQGQNTIIPGTTPSVPDTDSNVQGPSVLPEETPNAPVTPEENTIKLIEILPWVWAFDAVLMLIYMFVSYVRLWNRVKISIPIGENIYICDQIQSPFILGVIRPNVYIPSHIGKDQMPYILAHEREHLRCMDHIWKPFGFVLLTVHWFNPLVWVAYILMCRDLELACDERVIRNMDSTEKRNYSETLLVCSSPGDYISACPVAFGEIGIKERIKRIFSYKKPKVWIIGAVILVCVMVGMCFMTDPVGTQDNAKMETDDSESSEESYLKEVKNQIKKDYVKQMSSGSCACSTEDVQLSIVSELDSSYVLIIGCKCNSINLQASWENLVQSTVSDLAFYMPDGWSLTFAHKSGYFITLEEAYSDGWFSYNQLQNIWYDFYEVFPEALPAWRQENAGLAQSPERHPTGLDYTINEDGITCTITGIGACDRNGEVVIPEYIDGYHVTAIGENAFWAQSKITSVVMSDSVVRIRSEAFSGCKSLKTITLSASLKTIGRAAFENCESLEEINLPENLDSIGAATFSGCVTLTRVTIPTKVTSIYASTFKNCFSLEKITVPSGVKAIGEYAFINCTNLRSIEFEGTMKQWDAIVKRGPWAGSSPVCIIKCEDGYTQEN